MWGDVGRSGKIWGDLGRCGEITLRKWLSFMRTWKCLCGMTLSVAWVSALGLGLGLGLGLRSGQGLGLGRWS